MSYIKIKRSAVASKVPGEGDLEYGELAINTYDGKIFLKHDSGAGNTVVHFTSDDALSITESQISDLGSYITGITGESIKNLSDVYSSMTPSDGQALVYDTTNGWQAETLAGSGDVSKVGTPVNNQIGVWTGDGTIEGNTDFTWDGSSLTIAAAGLSGGTAYSNYDDIIIDSSTSGGISILSGSSSVGGIYFGDSSDGGAGGVYYLHSTDTMGFKVDGSTYLTISSSDVTPSGTVDGRDLATDGSKLDAIEASADVTDTTNVTAAGALMDSEVDADIKTLSLPASTTISTFGASLIDDAAASNARTTLDVDPAGTDNSTDVTLAGTGTYLSLAGQAITVDPITESDISDLGSYITGITGEPLSDLSDATITAIASGELLKWSGSAWINNTLAEAGISATSHNHSGTYEPADGTILKDADIGVNVQAYDADLTTYTSNPLTAAELGQLQNIGAEAISATEWGYVAAATAAFTSTLESKIDAIEASADVTDATNVNAAGAVMNSDSTTASMSFVIDEDTLVSNLSTKVPTQQSVKAYVDSAVASQVTYEGSYNASTNSPDLDTSPSGINTGAMYTVTVAGTFFATALEIGDVLIAEQDNPTLESHWTVVNKDLDAASIKTSYESNSDTNAFTDADESKLDGIEASADVTDTTNVTAAGALMDSEVDADIKTLSLPASTTISTFGASLIDDAAASNARSTLDVDQAGTDNSTDVTLGGTGTYISISGQVITVDPITESDISDLGTYLTGITAEPLSDISDVTITSIASGELIKWNGSAWINNTLAEAGISATSHNHSGVYEPADGTILKDADIGGSVQAYSAVLAATTASFLTADESKLDGIEASATADQSASEILTAIKTVDGTGSGLDADLLDGQEGAYYAPIGSPQFTGEAVFTNSSPEVFWETTSASHYNFRLAAQETKSASFEIGGSTTANADAPGSSYNVIAYFDADGDVQVVSGNFDVASGNITISGTVDGRDIATDGSKLDGIEASADVTDATNVTSAGALMDSELTDIASVKALNQGVATTDSPTFANMYVGDYIYHDGDTNTYIRLTSDDLRLYAGGDEILRADEDGTPTLTFGTVWDYKFNTDTLWIGGTAGSYTDKVGINTATPSEALDVVGNIAVSGTVDGRDLATDGSKLDGISAGAEVNRALVSTVAASTSTTDLDMADSINFHVDLTASTTFTLTNLASYIGQSGVIVLEQDVTGGRIITLSAEMKTPIGGATITQVTTASTRSTLSYYIDDASNVFVNYIGNFA